MKIRDHGLPTAPGWYWVQFRPDALTEDGRIEIVEIYGSERLHAEGYADVPLTDIGYAWQPVVAPVVEE